MSVEELRALQESGESFELLDVRTPGERETASIEGSKLLTQEEAKRIETLPKDAVLVFYCHHAQRSHAAANYFRQQGFTDVHNLTGGIDAWSQQVDPAVPRY